MDPYDKHESITPRVPALTPGRVPTRGHRRTALWGTHMPLEFSQNQPDASSDSSPVCTYITDQSLCDRQSSAADVSSITSDSSESSWATSPCNATLLTQSAPTKPSEFTCNLCDDVSSAANIPATSTLAVSPSDILRQTVRDIQSCTRIELPADLSIIFDGVMDAVIDLFDSKIRQHSATVPATASSILQNDLNKAQTPEPIPDMKLDTATIVNDPTSLAKFTKCRIEGPAEEAVMREAFELARRHMQQDAGLVSAEASVRSSNHDQVSRGRAGAAYKSSFKWSDEVKVLQKARRSDLALGPCLLYSNAHRTDEFWGYFTESTGKPKRGCPRSPSPLRRVERVKGEDGEDEPGA